MCTYQCAVIEKVIRGDVSLGSFLWNKDLWSAKKDLKGYGSAAIIRGNLVPAFGMQIVQDNHYVNISIYACTKAF